MAGNARRTSRAVVALVVAGVTLAGCLPGARDVGFGSNGSVALGASTLVAVTPSGDGGLVVLDRGTTRLGLMPPDGSFDPAWSEPFPEVCGSPGSVQADGSEGYLVVCDRPPDGAHLDLVRITVAGTLDTTFGVGGVAQLPAPDGFVSVTPLTRGGYMAVQGVTRSDGLPWLVVQVLDDAGTLVTTRSHRLSATPVDPAIPPFATVVAGRDRSALVVAFLGVDRSSTVLRLDHHGRVRLRLDGPWPGATGSFSTVAEAIDLPDGRLAVRGASTSTPHSPRPPTDLQYFVEIYSRRGVHERSIDVAVPAGGPLNPNPVGMLASTNGPWLWVGGTTDFRGCDPTGTCSAMVRYDTTTGALDTTFGDDGAVYLEGLADLLPAGEDRVYALSYTGLQPVVTRLWDTRAPDS
jgi:hypothetical protein